MKQVSVTGRWNATHSCRFVSVQCVQNLNCLLFVLLHLFFFVHFPLFRFLFHSLHTLFTICFKQFSPISFDHFSRVCVCVCVCVSPSFHFLLVLSFFLLSFLVSSASPFRFFLSLSVYLFPYVFSFIWIFTYSFLRFHLRSNCSYPHGKRSAFELIVSLQ